MSEDQFNLMFLEKMDCLINAIHLVKEQLGSVCHELAYIGNQLANHDDEIDDFNDDIPQ